LRVLASIRIFCSAGAARIREVATMLKKSPVESKSAVHNDDSFNGTRKLVRPHLPFADRRRDSMHTEDPLSHAMILLDGHGAPESSHAEAFYFQKQMQLQTEMTVVLEDGEQVHGVIQWYDKCVVKLRVGRSRVMIYKSGIKYMYKASEAYPVASVMK
jgi:host factor-I protein